MADRKSLSRLANPGRAAACRKALRLGLSGDSRTIDILKLVAAGKLSPAQAEYFLSPPRLALNGHLYSSNWKSVERLLRLHEKHRVFYLLAAAFRICRDNGFGIPDELLERLDSHFSELMKAKNVLEGKAALGFGTGKKGRGKWQGKAATELFKTDNVIDLVDQAFGFVRSKKKAYDMVSAFQVRPWRSIKYTYLKGSRRQKKR